MRVALGVVLPSIKGGCLPPLCDSAGQAGDRGEVQDREGLLQKGYYMYRDRFSFKTEAGRSLAEVEIPRGKVKEDRFFGKSETFRDLVQIRVPVSAEDAAKGSLLLRVTSQGCSDKGVCYAPLEQTVRVSVR